MRHGRQPPLSERPAERSAEQAVERAAEDRSAARLGGRSYKRGHILKKNARASRVGVRACFLGAALATSPSWAADPGRDVSGAAFSPENQLVQPLLGTGLDSLRTQKPFSVVHASSGVERKPQLNGFSAPLTGALSPYAVPSHLSPPPAAVETFPSAGVIGQPRRVSEQQNQTSPHRHQGAWGRFNVGNGELAGFGPVGTYGVAPWAEDWSALRDPSKRTDPLDFLKYISLNRSGSVYLSFSGETRLRNWYETQPLLGTIGHQGAGRFQVRNLYGGDLHVGEHFRAFGQIVNGDAGGWDYFGYDSKWRKRLGVEQLFGEFKGKLAGATTGLMLGRQQFLDAPSWLIYNRNTPNVPLTWNGARAYALWNATRVDAFGFIQTDAAGDRLFGQGFDTHNRLYGVTAAQALPDVAIAGQKLTHFLQVYWYGFDFNGGWAKVAKPVGNAAGTQTRQNFGFRWYGTARNFEGDLGVDAQRGRFDPTGSGRERPVHAYAARGVFGWRYPSSFLHPFIGIQAEIYSGGNASKTHGAIGTFVAPFSPQNATLDASRTFGHANLLNVGPVMSVTPMPRLSLHFRILGLWRPSLSDALYSTSGRYAFLNGSALHTVGHWVGLYPQGNVQFQIDRHLKWQLDGGGMFLSNRLRAAGAKEDDFMISTVTFRF